MKLPTPSPTSRPSLRGSSVDADFDLAVLGAALWRNRMKILRPTLIVALVTFAAVLLVPSKYLSETRVLVVGRDNIYLRPDADRDPSDRANVDAEAVTSQAQLVLSRDLAIEVIDKLKLGERPEFDPARGHFSLIRALLGSIGLVKNLRAMTPEERALDVYYSRLNVYPIEKSRVIVIGFLSEDPRLAAQVANAIADAYLERQRLAKQEQAASAGRWLAGEIESMRKKVTAAEAKVEEFRANSNLLVGPNGTTLSAQELGDLNAQLANARAQKAAAAAKAKVIRQMLKAGDPIEASDILNSELIRRLSEQRVTLRAQLAEQSSSLLDGHPRIKELRAQINDLDKQIRHEAETVARSLENDAKLADARVESEMTTLEQIKNQAASINGQDVELRALQRDAKSQRDLLESYLAKYREATARDTIASAPPDARVISRALVSNVPAYPKKLPTVLIATLATLVLCSGMVVTREFLADPAAGSAAATAGTAEPVETAAPAAAIAQERQAAVIKGQRPNGLPVSALEELARDLHRTGGAGTPVAFFSVVPQLETSGIAIKFARTLAKDGRAVLIGLGTAGADDAAIAQISGDPAAPGLAELAAGTASFGEIITRDKASRLHLIVSGRDRRDRRDLLAAPIVARNFAALAMTYAYVVIDAGAIEASDLSAIAALAPHAFLLAETFTGLATDKARGHLEDSGFDRVTVLVTRRSDADTSTSVPAAGKVAGAAPATAVA